MSDDTIEFDIRPTRTPVPAAERASALADPGFGKAFTDHMITLRWSADRGWHDGRLEPLAPFGLHPASLVFHYAQEIFEGMKAYRRADGSVAMFRPEMNAARFNASARRMAMPELPEDTFVRALELLVAQDSEWVPSAPGAALYLRPVMIATQAVLGFSRPSDSYLFYVIACPVEAYFGARLRALTVWLSQEYARAATGGTGSAKTGGNYGGALLATRQAAEEGCDQVVWLDSAQHTWVEELGGMNLFFVSGTDRPQVMTPALTGTLLPGVTRDSLLKLAPSLGIGATEGRISTEEWREQCASGELTEVFACGTAAVMAPVGRVRGAGTEWTVGDGEPGPVTLQLREELLGIQYGTRPDPFGWVHKVC